MTDIAIAPGSGGGAATGANVPKLGGGNNPKTSPALQTNQAPRFRHLARRIHALGPQALAYFLADLARGAPLVPTLEAYASLEPHAAVIAAYAVDPGPFCLAGGRRP